MTDYILISGCSCGGKSTLIDALRASGHRTVSEPGRRIVTEELERDGAALPWVDMAAFARRAVEMARADLAEAETWAGPVFFDRGLFDAAVALERAAGVPIEETLGNWRPYRDPVFMAPPWPELFKNDPERRHGYDEALDEYEALMRALSRLGCKAKILPRTSVAERIDFLFDWISNPS